MWQNDPFFKNGKDKLSKTTYIEDVLRTCRPKLPERDNSTYERALQFRKREKERVDALANENEYLRAELKSHSEATKKAHEAIRRHNDLYKSLSSMLNSKGKENEPPSNGNSGGTSPDDVPSIQTSNCNPGGGHEKVRELRGDMGGQGAKHSDEGRQERNEGEPERSVEGSGSENRESVPAGGDIRARGANDDE